MRNEKTRVEQTAPAASHINKHTHMEDVNAVVCYSKMVFQSIDSTLTIKIPHFLFSPVIHFVTVLTFYSYFRIIFSEPSVCRHPTCLHVVSVSTQNSLALMSPLHSASHSNLIQHKNRKSEKPKFNIASIYSNWLESLWSELPTLLLHLSCSVVVAVVGGVEIVFGLVNCKLKGLLCYLTDWLYILLYDLCGTDSLYCHWLPIAVCLWSGKGRGMRSSISNSRSKSSKVMPNFIPGLTSPQSYLRKLWLWFDLADFNQHYY